ncbi:DMT family transporter [Candidatus Curtissbacteria bacterium]|nr:DMT family transporter [Candidatus Curtissbacteria bacterium]
MKLRSATLLIILATLIWGATPAVMKLTLQEVPPFSLAFIRMFFATFVLVFFTIRKLHVEPRDFKNIIVATLAGTTFNLTFFFFGLKYAPAINAALLVATTPIFTLLASHIFLREKLHRKITIATIIALLGVVIIIGMPSTGFNLIELAGNLLLLLSSLSWVFYELSSKKLLKIYDPITITFYSTAIGALTFFPFAVFEFLQNPAWTNKVTTSGLLGIIYGIIFASVIAYWAWMKGLSKLGATEASFFFYLDPISGAILAVILLSETITSQLFIGALFIAAAVVLVEYHRKAHPLYTKQK